MKKKLMKAFLFVVLSIVLSACSDRETEPSEPEEDIYIVRCPPPATNHLKSYQVPEYQPPESLRPFLDTVITQGTHCRCYEGPVRSGFCLYSSRITADSLLITCIPNNQNFIGNYSQSALYQYGEHFFVFNREDSFFITMEMGLHTVFAYLPDTTYINYDPEAVWTVFFVKDSIVESGFYPCF